MESAPCDVKQPPDGGRTLAEWKKPLLVTFVFLVIITTGFVSYTYVYFNRINQRVNNAAAVLINEELDSAVLQFEPELIEDRESSEDKPCEGDPYRRWDVRNSTLNISETQMIYRLDPDETFMYLNRPPGRGIVVNNSVCNELKALGQQMFFKIFKELQTTFGFDRAEEIIGRTTGMINLMNSYERDEVWTWSKVDSNRYYVNLKDSVLSYVASGPNMYIDSSEEELLNTRTFQFDCPGVKIADDLRAVEMGWIAVGPTFYFEREAENLLEFSAAFKSINVWRTLADKCIAKFVKSIKHLNIMSYCGCSESQVNCTKDTCAKLWKWPRDRLIGFKIWYQDGQWTLAYQYDNPDVSDEIQKN